MLLNYGRAVPLRWTQAPTQDTKQKVINLSTIISNQLVPTNISPVPTSLLVTPLVVPQTEQHYDLLDAAHVHYHSTHHRTWPRYLPQNDAASRVAAVQCFRLRLAIVANFLFCLRRDSGVLAAREGRRGLQLGPNRQLRRPRHLLWRLCLCGVRMRARRNRKTKGGRMERLGGRRMERMGSWRLRKQQKGKDW